MNATWLKPLRPWLRWPGATRRASLIAMTAVACTGSAAGLLVPGFTAYTERDADGARVSQHGNGVTHWTDPELKVVWFGQFKQTGDLKAGVSVRLPKDAKSKLRLTVGNTSHQAEVAGAGADTAVTVD